MVNPIQGCQYRYSELRVQTKRTEINTSICLVEECLSWKNRMAWRSVWVVLGQFSLIWLQEPGFQIPGTSAPFMQRVLKGASGTQASFKEFRVVKHTRSKGPISLSECLVLRTSFHLCSCC